MPITNKANIRPSSNNVILQKFKKPVPAFCVLILNKGKGSGNYLLVAINTRCATQDGAKNLCSSPGRRSASSWELQPAAARTTGNVQGLECNLQFI